MNSAISEQNLKSGYIHLFRSILNDPTSPLVKKRKFTSFEAMIDLLLTAQGTDTTRDVDGKPMPVLRGSLWAAHRYLADKWHWSPSGVRRFLVFLERDGFLIRRRFKKGTILDIVNYNEYNPLRKQTNRERTVDEPQVNHNRTKYKKGNKGKEGNGNRNSKSEIPEFEPDW